MKFPPRRLLFCVLLFAFVIGTISLWNDDYMLEKKLYDAKVVQKYQGNSESGLRFLIVGEINGKLHSLDVDAAEYTSADIGSTQKYLLVKRFYEPNPARRQAFDTKLCLTGIVGLIVLVWLVWFVIDGSSGTIVFPPFPESK